MHIAVTGHRALTAATLPLVRAALRNELAHHDPTSLIGVSCLADGTDQVFAEEVLDVGGRLKVVLVQADHRHLADSARFTALLDRAALVREVPATASRAQAWTAAAYILLDGADLLLAVWDGSAAAVPGSTGDVVNAAAVAGVPTVRIWPAGADRRND